MPMNKKTFTLALLFLCLTLVWFGIYVYWDITRHLDVYNTLLSLLFVIFGAAMTWNEAKKKKRRHIEEVDRTKIP